MRLNKKAELSTQQIVLLIVLIASFAILLFFLVRLNLGGESEKDICHNSVSMQALPNAGSTPLKCSRTDVCITRDGSCEGMVKPKKFKVKSLDEIYAVLADEMADCWWEFGEGKIDYIGSKPAKRNYCSICSQILLDDSLNKIPGVEDGNISKDGLYDYLSKNNVSNKDETYAEYLFGTSDVDSLKKQILKDSISKENHIPVGTFGKMQIGEDHQQFIVMGIVSETGWVYEAVGAGLAAVALVTPIGWVATAVVIGAGVGTAAYGGKIAGLWEPEIAALMIKGDGIPNRFMVPTIQEADSTKFEKLNCYEITTST